MMPPTTSNLARKFDFLQDRAQRRPIREAALEVPGDAAKKTNINHLKEFYLQRLAKTEPNAATRFGAVQGAFGGGGDAQPQGAGPHAARSTFAQPKPLRDIEDLEIMCNNCFSLIKSSEAASCTGSPKDCPVACKNGSSDVPAEKPTGIIGLLDLKLQKLRGALEARLADSNVKVNVMRHLTQLRYHVDTAAKWAVGCSEIGALSDHTVQQVKQLSATSRVLAPAVYIFSKRIENIVVQKERELRKAATRPTLQQLGATGMKDGGSEAFSDHDDGNSSVADVNSVVSELDSSCGTQYAETAVTQEGAGATDVGNVQDANEYLSLKNEDEMRRWFYSQCLTVKLSCTDKTRARKTLISDLYARVKAEAVPIEGWVQWIRSQLMPEESAGQGGAAPDGGEAPKQAPKPVASAPSHVGGAPSHAGAAAPSHAGGAPSHAGATAPSHAGGAPGHVVGSARGGSVDIDRTIPLPMVATTACGAPAGAAGSTAASTGRLAFLYNKYAPRGCGQRPPEDPQSHD